MMKLTTEQMTEKIQKNMLKDRRIILEEKTDEIDVSKLKLQKFQNLSSKHNKPPVVIINEKGIIRFNTLATQSTKLKDFDQCYLYYDEGKKLIVIELTHTKDRASVTLRKRQGWSVIISLSYFKQFGINITKTTSYNITTQDQYIIIDLKKEAE